MICFSSRRLSVKVFVFKIRLDIRRHIIEQSRRFCLLRSTLTHHINKNTPMNTRLRLTILAAALSLLTPATSIVHAQMRTASQGMNVPDGTR